MRPQACVLAAPGASGMSSDPDAKIVLACQENTLQGLEGPFRDLYEIYKDRVYNVCYRIAGNPTDALDASQETFGILFRKLGDFRFESKFSSWVYRIAVNGGQPRGGRASIRGTIGWRCPWPRHRATSSRPRSSGPSPV